VEPGGQASHRRYTDPDLETLLTIKGLLSEGQTYIQVGKRLEALRLRETVTAIPAPEDETRVTVLGPTLQQQSTVFPAVAVLADTLHTVANGQQMLLGSQQANRDLLTVVIQDNFTLKEENAKLRDRMLELERDLAEVRRLDVARRETIDARLRQIEEQAHQSQKAPTLQPKTQNAAAAWHNLGLIARQRSRQAKRRPPNRSHAVAPVIRTGTSSPTAMSPGTSTKPSISGASRYDRPIVTPSPCPSTNRSRVRPTWVWLISCEMCCWRDISRS
jgi:DNA-binding transcriptional MerR regulator